MWANGWLLHGSGKMPNDVQQLKIKKKYKLHVPPNLVVVPPDMVAYCTNHQI
jgi:hypothetical protein